MTYRSISAEVLPFKGDKGDQCEAYYARPTGDGKVPGVVLIHHMPGWDEWTTEATRKLAHHGFATIAPHLNCRLGPGSPDDLAAKARAQGGVHDDQILADVDCARAFLMDRPEVNGKIGVIGFCSGGRHTFMAACRYDGFSAAVDCWGGNLIVDDPSKNTPARPIPGIELADKLSCPLIGIFGNDDQNPTPEHVDRTEAILQKHNKTYEFHRYDGAGHAFFNHTRTAYRPEQANDGWAKAIAFLHKHLD